jgi:L-asparaginase/Glu-tRNA(Gln) amidotransferase subunit D
VVVTQGTVTIEEMAFILDLFLKSDKAVVVTGASGAVADSIERVVWKIPVAVASRTGIGETFTRTYGFLGPPHDLAVLHDEIDAP